MGHKVKTWAEGLLVAVVIGLLGYVAENASLVFDADKSTLYAGALATALAVARGYVAARYATPPDVKEKIEEGTFPERRDLSTRQERVADEALAEKIVDEVRAERKSDTPVL